MKKAIAIIISIILVMAIMLPAAAFSTITVKGIKLDKSKITLKVGQTYILKATLTPKNTTQKKLTYVTGNKKIATIDATGKITGVSAGTTTITVYTPIKNILAKCNVTITQPQPEKPMEISMAVYDIEKSGLDSAKPDAIYDLVKKKFNIIIKPVPFSTTQEVNDQDNLWAAAGQLPDLFIGEELAKTPTLKTWVDEKIIKPLPGDLSAYPNITKLFQAEDYKAYKYADGKYYCIPKPAYDDLWQEGVEKVIYYRKDWIDQLGMKVPENTNEFIALIKAFKTKNPEERNDCVGYTAANTSHFADLLAVFGPELIASNKTSLRNNGKWIPAFFMPNVLNEIKGLKKIYDSGYVDKDIPVLKGTDGEDKFASGRAGAFSTNGGLLTQSHTKEKFEKNYPGKKYEDCVLVTHYWKAADGNYYRFTAPRPYAEDYFNANIDDKKMSRILALYDWDLSPEGAALRRLGFEGKDYTKEGDTITLTREKDDKGAFKLMADLYPSTIFLRKLVTWDQSFDSINPVYSTQLLKSAADLNNWAKNEAKPVPLDYRIAWLNFPSKDKISFTLADDIMKVVLSSNPDKAYQDVVDGYNKQGLQQYIDELNKAATDAGISAK